MRFRPVITLIVGTALGGWAADAMSHSGSHSGNRGVPLAELDMSGPAPDGVSLAGPDLVLVSRGARFAISVDEGSPAAEELRFRIEDGALEIGRRDGYWTGADDLATVRVVLPAAPRGLSVSGSGALRSEALAVRADLAVSGSGSLETPRVAGDALAVSISGSGTYRAAGQVRMLELGLSGSGTAALSGLTAERADVSIAGSGDAVFASDGEVTASIAGSGDVRVLGNARCTASRAGAGRLTCGPDDAGG